MNFFFTVVLLQPGAERGFAALDSQGCAKVHSRKAANKNEIADNYKRFLLAFVFGVLMFLPFGVGLRTNFP
jgi:hypothetical protein